MQMIKSVVGRLSERRSLWILKGILGVLLLSLVFRSLDLATLFRILRSLEPFPLFIAISIFYPTQLLAAWRWQRVLLDFGNRVAFWSVFRYSIWGQVSSLVLSQLGGDVVRAIGVSRDTPHKSGFILAVVVDKLSILIAILAFVMLAVFVDRLAATNHYLFSVAVVLLIGASATLLLLTQSGRLWAGLIVRLSRWSLISRYLVDSNALKVQVSFGEVLTILGLALFVQTLNSIGSYFMALAFSIQIDLLSLTVIGAIVSLTQLVPLTLGGIGIREGAFVALLALFGISAERSLVYSLFGFGCVALLVIVAWLGMEWLYPRYILPRQSRQGQ